MTLLLGECYRNAKSGLSGQNTRGTKASIPSQTVDLLHDNGIWLPRNHWRGWSLASLATTDVSSSILHIPMERRASCWTCRAYMLSDGVRRFRWSGGSRVHMSDIQNGIRTERPPAKSLPELPYRRVFSLSGSIEYGLCRPQRYFSERQHATGA
jgi:hypothetical protein